MRISFLEGVARVHEVGGGVVLALQLQVELGRLAKGVPRGWKGERRSSGAAARRDGAEKPR